VRAIGNRSGQPWRVPIPRATGSGVFATLNIQGGESVVTRAAHDRDWIYQGVAYHQILNPRNGRPARASQSVTVVHDEATAAAAAAIALFVAGPEEWHRVASALGVRHVILADSEGTVHITPELRDRLKIVDRTVRIAVSPPISPSIQSATSTRPLSGTTLAALRQTGTRVD
jgi:thiamine biosynthesis lipoprotein